MTDTPWDGSDPWDKWDAAVTACRLAPINARSTEDISAACIESATRLLKLAYALAPNPDPFGGDNFIRVRLRDQPALYIGPTGSSYALLEDRDAHRTGKIIHPNAFWFSDKKNAKRWTNRPSFCGFLSRCAGRPWQHAEFTNYEAEDMYGNTMSLQESAKDWNGSHTP